MTAQLASSLADAMAGTDEESYTCSKRAPCTVAHSLCHAYCVVAHVHNSTRMTRPFLGFKVQTAISARIRSISRPQVGTGSINYDHHSMGTKPV